MSLHGIDLPVDNKLVNDLYNESYSASCITSTSIHLKQCRLLGRNARETPTILIDRSHLSEKDTRTRVQSYPIVYVFTSPIICDFHWILLDTRLRVTLRVHESRTSCSRVAREFHACTRYLVGELYRTLVSPTIWDQQQNNVFLLVLHVIPLFSRHKQAGHSVQHYSG